VPKLTAATQGGSHAVVCLAPSVGAFKSAVGIARRGGTIVMVGLPKGELPLPIFDVVLRGITVRGSIVGAFCVRTEGAWIGLSLWMRWYHPGRAGLLGLVSPMPTSTITTPWKDWLGALLIPGAVSDSP